MAGWLSFITIAALALLGTTLWGQRRLPALVSLLVAALVLRFIGGTARLQVIELVYDGLGDALQYFRYGVAFAEDMGNLDFGFLSGSDEGQWWGTHFIRTVCAFIVFFVGDSIQAAFLVFALFAFTGLVLCVKAYEKAFGEAALPSYAKWVWLLPSLWFWPSSIGKESIMILAVGILIWGYVTRSGLSRWVVVTAGILLAAAVRPHVAAIIACALLVAESAISGKIPISRRVGGFFIAGALAALSVSMGLDQMGLGDSDLEGMQEFFEYRSVKTAAGGSKIAQASGWSAVPMALITILMRPFPWEAGGMSAFSSVEIWVIWIVVALRRKDAWALLRSWRTNRFTRFGLPFALGLSLMYGLAFANLGIIARQRAVILPFLVALAAAPALARSSVARTRSLVPVRGTP